MKFIYIGRIGHTMLDAASIRVHNVAKMLKAQGHQVDFICQEGVVPNGRFFNEESTFYGLFDEKISKVSVAYEWLFGRKAIKCLKLLLQKEKYDGVILYNAPIALAKKTLKLCKKHNAVLINDVTEWYQNRLSNGAMSYAYAKFVDRRIRCFDQYCDGIIAISPYLEEYYRARSIPTFNLPPVFEDDGQPNTSRNERCRFLYAGSPSKKDELFHFIEAVKAVNDEQVRVEMTVIGAPVPQNSEELSSKGIRYFPRMSHADVLAVLREHDFSVLLRREERYAKAGYSTKVAEALYNGTPVFCNELGGADTDVQSGYNGIKISCADVDTIKAELMRIVKMSFEDLRVMKENSFAMGQQKYSLKNYEQGLSSFLLSLLAKYSGEENT